MDKNKLEISGKASLEPIPTSYKPIPEKDMEEDALSRPKSLIKVKASPEADGAHEKMLTADDQVPEVVVYNNEKSPQNGDAKLDIADLKQSFVGLTKEELMRYANDPFWVRLRWFLFVTFWLLWAAMLVGAILIIYAAPKCDPPPPRTWYQQGPLIQLPPDSKPETLKDLDKNIQGIIVQWPADTYANLEDSPEVLKLIKAANEQGTNVIIELEPSISTVWFEASENKDPNYDDYYIWKSGDSSTPPNNWISPNNISSWKYSEVRREFYYSPFEKPHLNFRKRSVVQEFNNAIERFLVANVSGIRLRNAAFLLVDSSFQNEELQFSASPSLDLTNYGFFKHSKTENIPDIGFLLKEWRTLIRNKTTDGPLMIAHDLEQIDSYKFNESLVVDMPLQSRIFSKPVLSVNQTANSLNQTFNIDNIEWPLWKANTDALPSDVLNIITYLLPGAPLIDVNDKVDPVLLKLRNKSPSIMRGICGVYKLNNNTVLAFIRVTPGSPGILVAVNPTEEVAVVNLNAEIPPLMNLQEVTIRHFSDNYNETSFRDIGGKKEATAIPITPKSAIVLEYVPNREE